MGFDVSIPLTESAPYDLVVDDGQADGKEYLLKECLSGRRSVSPQPIHLLGAVAESGRMQLP